LVELFDLKATIISLSLFANSFRNNENLKLVGFFATHQFLRKRVKFYINWYLNFFSSIQFFKSFGIENFVFPKKNFKLDYVSRITLEIMNQIKTKKDILKIKIENVHVGDLLYDTYIRENNLVTIDIKDKKFSKFVNKSVQLFFYWKKYLKKNKIEAIIATHTVYLSALVLRIASSLKINVFCVNFDKIYRITKKRPLIFGNFEDYPKMLNNLKKKEIKKGLSLAKYQLKKRFKGQKDILYNISAPLSDGTYSNNVDHQNSHIIKPNNNFKILIAAHDFNDAPHAHKDLLFEDMYEWLIFLGEKSLQFKNYDWYIKLHPADYDTNFIKINFFLNRYNKFKLLPKKISHNQIINNGIRCVLTCFGSIGHEYPFFGIPVINCGHNPHIAYKFNFHPKTKKEYEYLINNLEHLKVDKKYNNQIYEFYMIRYYLDYNLFPDITDMKLLDNISIFEIFFKRYDNHLLQNIMKDYQDFIYSKKRRLITNKQLI
jgi:hypothetical protein